jgi:type II secretory ATPase GspE/PulE/Tfp pilus assembly ATPase PilB-like protein
MATTEVSTGKLAPPDLAARLGSLLEGEERHMKEALDLLLGQAVFYRASDVHVEPYQGAVRVRLRVDGYFREIAELPVEVQEQLVARVKVMAGLVVHRRDMPQEGRIRSGQADFRVSIIPTVAGEKLAIRIFDALGRIMELEELGFRKEVLDTFQKTLLDLSGAVLLTGPSGSGKTTTLYSSLRRIHDRCGDHASITTIEDPVEFDLGLFAQMQVNHRNELTFARALTAVLRQDPKVIMLGEIRDVDACEIAMRAGLTGHLVLSTIHSGTACGVVTRLLDMDIEPFVVTSALKAVLAQRLARSVCPDCVEEYEPEPWFRSLVEGAEEGFSGPYHRGAGCETCLGSGYYGRLALTELLRIDDFMAGYIGDRTGTRRLEEAARENGFEPLLTDGIKKVVAGKTTIEEVVRAAGREAAV